MTLKNKDRDLIEGQLSRAMLTQDLPIQALMKLVKGSRVERYALQTLVHVKGQAMGHMRLIVHGYIDLIAYDKKGNATVLTQLGPGQWATLLGAFDQTPPIHDFYAGAKTTAIAVPRQLLNRVADENPQIYRQIIAYIGHRFRCLMEWTEQSTLLKHEFKMAKLLVISARFDHVSADSCNLKITQKHIARMAHCSRQTANEQLGKLERLQLIQCAYGRIHIPSLERLNTFAHEPL